MPTDTSGPNIEELRTFTIFAQHREVGRTAAAIGMSVSVVSRRLQELTGPPNGLLEKRGNALLLTAKGETVLPTVKRVLREYDQLIGRLTNREPVAEVVRIAAGTGLAASPFPKALAAFRTAQPEVGVRVHVCRGRERIRGVVQGEFDLALVSHDDAQVQAICGEATEVRVETLREQSLVVVAAVNSEDGKKLAGWPTTKPVSPAMLASLSVLGMDPQSNVRRQLDRALIAAGLGQLKMTVFPGGWTASLGCAQHGLGAAVIPADLYDPTDTNLVARPFLTGFRLTDRVVYPATPDNDRTSKLVACLKAAFAPPA